ncbi:hypothetical protein AURDEDRAFT_164572 [Auricularia subglabra TFB-10046 SS5]|nr:hypothetical protein AURDEDRAFT_164572 [Auricularia subglabra TFB-10046 SS5]
MAKKTRLEVSEQGSRRALEYTLSIIRFTKTAVPVDIALVALSSLEGLVCIVRDTLKNKADFADIIRECVAISDILQRAMQVPQMEHNMDFMNGVEDLRDTAFRIHRELSHRTQRRFLMRLVSVYVDKETIAEWRNDLARCERLFSTNLLLMANTTIMQMHKNIQDIRDTVAGPSSTAVASQRLPRYRERLVIHGRESTISEITSGLLNFRHVALLGAGGIGKTALAQAVLEHEAVQEAFAAQRYLLSFAELDTNGVVPITLGMFLSHVARVLGLHAPQDLAAIAIVQQLKSCPAMLVLDGVDVILHAGQDSGRIAAFIADIGKIDSIVMLFTSQSSSLPFYLAYDTIEVPHLEVEAARETFTTAYRGWIDEEGLDQLLAALNHHPLAISLLAKVARESCWKADEALAQFGEEANRLAMDASSHSDAQGGWEHQILAAIVHLAFRSWEFLNAGSMALDILRTIAYLPQGVNLSKLSALFPSVPDASSIIDSLCRLSLTYITPTGDYVTMHSPLRHFVLRSCKPSELALLDGIRTHYHSLILYDCDDDTLLREQLNSAYVRTLTLQTMLSSLRADMLAKIPVLDAAQTVRRAPALRRTPSAGSRI